MARLPLAVHAAAGVPSSNVTAASRMLRITSRSANADTGLVLRDSHRRIAAALSGHSARLLVLNPHWRSAHRMAFGSGAPFDVAIIGGMTVTSVHAIVARRL